MQEAAYRAFAPSIIGPRLLSLAGAVIAACVLFAWLAARGASALVALALAMVFFLDPMFVQGYRGARVDAWVFALMLGACLLVRTPSALRHTNAGALIVTAGFVWPSAIFLAPLVAIEMRSLRALPWMAVGAIFGAVLCALPLLPQLQAMVSVTSGTIQSVWGGRSVQQIVSLLLSSFQQSPLIPAAGLIASIVGGRRALPAGAALAVALLLMLQTSIYVHRAVYLLPYFIAIIATWVDGPGSARSPRWAAVVLAVFLAWAGTTSLVLRPVLAWSARDARDPETFRRAATALPSLQSRLVFLGPWEFYYVGRENGWRMVRADPGIGPAASRVMMERLDYALIPVDDPAAPVNLLLEMGWRVVAHVTVPSPAATLFSGSVAAPRRYDLYSRSGLETMNSR